MTVRSLRELRGARSPTLRLPTFRRVFHERAGSDGDACIGYTEIRKRGHESHVPHQPSRGGCGKQRSRAEPGHRNSRDQPSPVGEPLHQDSNRNDVAHAQPDSSNDSISEIEPPKSVGGKTSEEHSAAPEQARCQCDQPWASAFHPQSAHNRADPEKKPADQKCPSDLGNAPSEFLGERDAKDAPCVSGAQRHLHAHAGNGKPPTIQHGHDSSTGNAANDIMRISPAVCGISAATLLRAFRHFAERPATPACEHQSSHARPWAAAWLCSSPERSISPGERCVIVPPIDRALISTSALRRK